MTIKDVRVEFNDTLGIGLRLEVVVDAVAIGREGIRHLQMAVADGNGDALRVYHFIVEHHIQRDDILAGSREGEVSVFLIARNTDAR